MALTGCTAQWPISLYKTNHAPDSPCIVPPPSPCTCPQVLLTATLHAPSRPLLYILFSQYMKDLGDLIVVREKKAMEFERRIREMDYSINMADDTLDPNKGRYEDQKKDLMFKQAQIAQKLEVLSYVRLSPVLSPVWIVEDAIFAQSVYMSPHPQPYMSPHPQPPFLSPSTWWTALLSRFSLLEATSTVLSILCQDGLRLVLPDMKPLWSTPRVPNNTPHPHPFFLAPTAKPWVTSNIECKELLIKVHMLKLAKKYNMQVTKNTPFFEVAKVVGGQNGILASPWDYFLH